VLVAARAVQFECTACNIGRWHPAGSRCGERRSGARNRPLPSVCFRSDSTTHRSPVRMTHRGRAPSPADRWRSRLSASCPTAFPSTLANVPILTQCRRGNTRQKCRNRSQTLRFRLITKHRPTSRLRSSALPAPHRPQPAAPQHVARST
jgi:hypothetical protein